MTYSPTTLDDYQPKKRLYNYFNPTTPNLQIGSGNIHHIQTKSIDDIVKSGAILSGDKIIGNESYSAGAHLVRDKYESFKNSEAGKKAVKELGDVQYNGYAMLSLGDAVAAIITSSDGSKILAWNSAYKHVLENPESHPEMFLEAMVHEMKHGTGELDEPATYGFVGDFFSNLAKSASSYLKKVYQRIAQASYRKGDVYAGMQPA